MRILFIGEIIGKSGVYTVKKLLHNVQTEQMIDFTIANANGATHGIGLGKNHAHYLLKLGIDLITLGNYCYARRDLVELLPLADVLVPANLNRLSPGYGWRRCKVGDKDICIITIMGQYGIERFNVNNPYQWIEDSLDKICGECSGILVNYHAFSSAEKQTMGHLLDGRVGAVIGSGARVPTADAALLPHGTGFVTDIGRTGSMSSVNGLDPVSEIRFFKTGVPGRYDISWLDLGLQGVVIDMKDDGSLRSFERIVYRLDEVVNETNS